ncbi:Homocysteine S-methyltransferase [Acrodontium crateriforme]|uniref:Homocysteine S-methyltransferase n=1 Tax=Acrodontium crateriforme TaxID=150365 RepID=A0AAQ3M3R9_9PEZI|nr:Homocysteine S-methyltransferase [Acrodontium crateriforme]
MLSKSDFQALLDRKGTLIIDGGLATELEKRGHDLNHALWSAKLLKENPDSITKLHYDYFHSGADIAITASYQASVEGMAKHFGMSETEALKLISLSVELAIKARDQMNDPSLLIAGSVGPFGAYLADGSEYRGDYKRTKSELQYFHRPRIEQLIKAGADILAIETMPQLLEIEAIMELLETEFPHAIALLCCTTKDAEHLSDGSAFTDLFQVVRRHQNRIVAVGINCVPLISVTDTLNHLHASAPGVPLICYPNSGEEWDAVTKTWKGAPPECSDLALLARKWIDSGAKLIGGCCRTSPSDIQVIRQAIDGHKP